MIVLLDMALEKPQFRAQFLKLSCVRNKSLLCNGSRNSVNSRNCLKTALSHKHETAAHQMALDKREFLKNRPFKIKNPTLQKIFMARDTEENFG